MNKGRLSGSLLLLSTAFVAVGCGGGGGASSSGEDASSSQGSFEEHSPEEVEAYMEGLLAEKRVEVSVLPHPWSPSSMSLREKPPHWA